MLFNVPQFIEIEDKIVGPLTAKQLGWIAIGGILLLICWATLDTSGFFTAAIIIGPIFGALAFYRPYNQPLIKFLASSFYFVLRPKIYIWKRYYDSAKTVHSAASVPAGENIVERKKLDSKKIGEISKILDNR